MATPLHVSPKYDRIYYYLNNIDRNNSIFSKSDSGLSPKSPSAQFMYGLQTLELGLAVVLDNKQPDRTTVVYLI